jgi:hypothetical protein
MKRFAATGVALAALAWPTLASAQTPPLPPGTPPHGGPPPAMATPAPAASPVASPAVTPTPAPPEAPTPAAPAPTGARAVPAPVADNHPRTAGKVMSIRLKRGKLVVRLACTADAQAKLQLRSGTVSIGQRRYRCSSTRTLRFRAPRSVARQAHGKDGADIQARVSATGFEPNLVRVRVRGGSAVPAAAAARASGNWMPCSWCTNLVFGGFGNEQILEYWVRTSGGWFPSNGWYLWWGDGQYYQSYASAYITTYRYWYYWDGSKAVQYYTEDKGP